MNSSSIKFVALLVSFSFLSQLFEIYYSDIYMEAFLFCHALLAYFLTRQPFIILLGFRYSVEKIPLYDSAEDEPFVKLHTVLNNPYSEFEGYLKNENPMILDDNLGAEQQLVSTALIDTSKNSVQLQNIVVGEIKNEAKEEPEDHPQNTQQTFSQQNAMISRIRSNTACRNYRIGPGPAAKKRARNLTNGRTKNFTLKQVDAKYVARLLELKEAQEEVLQYEVINAFYYTLCCPAVDC